MKTHRTFKIMLMALMLFAASASITSVDAEAKAYKAKTVKITSGKAKAVKAKKKIKKVAICSKNKQFTVYKLSDRKFKLFDTDYGKTQAVKITYTNGRTQKYMIKTVLPSYARKIVNELKPLLADPDKGLQSSLADWKKQIEARKVREARQKRYKFQSVEIALHNYKGLSRTLREKMSVDDILKNYTPSQKRALILEAYFQQRMEYGNRCWYRFRRENNKYFKLLYQGKFKGVCEDGAAIAYDICKYLGIKTFYVSSSDLNHAWCCVYAKDQNGKPYWHGIAATSYSYNLQASVPAKYNYGDTLFVSAGTPTKQMTKAMLKKYLYRPNSATALWTYVTIVYEH